MVLEGSKKFGGTDIFCILMVGFVVHPVPGHPLRQSGC